MGNVETFGKFRLGKGLKKAYGYTPAGATVNALQRWTHHKQTFKGNLGYETYIGEWWNPLSWFAPKPASIPVAVAPVKPPTEHTVKKATEHKVAAALIERGAPVDKAEATAAAVTKPGFDFKDPKTLAIAGAAILGMFLLASRKKKTTI
jgi:hypothetical protein